MTERSAARIGPRLVLGLAVIAVGVLLTLENLDYFHIEDLWRWWPVLIIALGLSRATQSRSGRIGGLVIAGVGTLLLLDSLRLLRFDFWELWPLGLVLIGVSLVWGSISRRGGDRGGSGGSPGAAQSPTGGSWVQASAVLGGTTRGTNSQEFQGGEATAVLGSCEIDLRQASIGSSEAVLDIFAVLGSIQVRIPADWSVVLRGTPVLGSFEDKTRQPANPTKRLIVKGQAVLGSVEVEN
jgi:predicted membrane protein